MSVNIQNFIPMIDAIICVANPSEMSPKKIRRAIQELFGVDLEPQKKQLNALILERFTDIQEYPRIIIKREELASKKAEIEELSKYKEEFATLEKKYLKLKSKVVHQRHQEEGKKEKDEKKKQEQPSRSLRRKKKVAAKKTEQKSKNKRRDTALTSFLYVLSTPLKEFLGCDENLPRTAVVKQVWDYIKEHNLQNPLDRREVFCDEKMEPVFGKKTTIFGLNKVLSKHLFNPSELVTPDEVSSREEQYGEEEESDNNSTAGDSDGEQDIHEHVARKKHKIKIES